MPRRVTPTVPEAVREYLEHCERMQLAPNTISGWKSILTRFARACGRIKTGSLAENHFFDFLYPSGDRQFSANTFNNYRSTLSQWLFWCQARGYYPRGAGVIRTNTRRRRVPKRVRRQLIADEILHLMDNARDARDRCLIATEANTGMRITDACRLLIKHVDLDTLYIRAKLDKSEDEILLPITLDLEEELKVWYRAYALDIGRPLQGDDYLIPARTPHRFDKPIDAPRYNPRRNIARPWHIIKDALTRANMEVEEGDAWHMLRRSLSAKMEELGNESGQTYDDNLGAVGAMLGHRDQATTEIYTGRSRHIAKRDEIMRGKRIFKPSTDAAVIQFPRAAEAEENANG